MYVCLYIYTHTYIYIYIYNITCGHPTNVCPSRGSSAAPVECSPSMRPQCTPVGKE